MQELIKRLKLQNIDFARIQETHNATDMTYDYLDYTIQFSPSYISKDTKQSKNEAKKGIGVAIAYRTSINVIK